MPMTGLAAPVTFQKARAYLAADHLNLVTDVETKLVLALASFDPSGLLAGGALVVQTAGYYAVSGAIAWVGASVTRASSFGTLVKVNGATLLSALGTSPSLGSTTMGCADVLHLAVGDAVELWACSHQATSTADIDDTAAGTFLTIHLLAGDDEGLDISDVYDRLAAIEADYVTAAQLGAVQDDVDDNADDIDDIEADYLIAASLNPYSTTVQVAAMIAAALAAYSTTVQVAAMIDADVNPVIQDLGHLDDRVAAIEADYTTANQATAIANSLCDEWMTEHQEDCTNYNPA